MKLNKCNHKWWRLCKKEDWNSYTGQVRDETYLWCNDCGSLKVESDTGSSYIKTPKNISKKS